MRPPSPLRKLRLLFVELAALLFVVGAAQAQNPCPAGAICNVTVNGTPYTVIGPCDTSAITGVSGCLVVGIGPQPGGPPLQVTGLDAPSTVEQDYTPGTPLSAFDQDAQQHIATLRKIAPDEINSYWSRGEVRAYMYLRLLQMANNYSQGTPLNASDQAVFNYYTNAINTERLDVANKAVSIYNNWASNPCGFQVPVGDPNAYLNRPDVANGTALAPAPCQLAQFPGFDCSLGECQPPTPSAEEFTGWAEGVIHRNEVNTTWANSLLNESFIPGLTLTQAQQAASDEYDKSFGGIVEGLNYLTALRSEINGIPTSAQTQAEQDLNGAWIDGLHDIASDRAEDFAINTALTIFQGYLPEGEEEGTTLGAKFASTEDQFFNDATDGIEAAIEEDAAGLISEGFDNVVGPAIMAAAVIAYTTWEAVQNGQVQGQLQTGATCAQYYNPANPSACPPASPTATLADYAKDDNGRQIIMTALVRSTMPDYVAARLAGTTENQKNAAIAPSQGPLVPSDPNFIVNGATAAATFTYLDWGGVGLITSVANGWFVQYVPGTNSAWARYASNIAYEYSPGCFGSCLSVNSEQWRAWLDGENFLAIRTGIIVGFGTVQDAVNACPGFLAPQGQNTDLGNVCVALSSGTNQLLQAGDNIVINGEVRSVSKINTDTNGNYYALVSTPFADTPQGNILVLTHPDSSCLTSNSLSPRTTSPDCTFGKTINTSAGPVTLNSNAATASFDVSGVSLTYGDTADISGATYFQSNSTGTVTYKLGPGSYGCTVTPQGVVMATAASTAFNGKCVITAMQAGAGQYTAPAPQTSSFSIGQKAVTIRANPLSKPYGTSLIEVILLGQFPTTVLTGITEQATGLLGSDVLVSVVAQSDGGAATAGIGSYPISLSQAMICNSLFCNLSFGAQGTVETANYAITYDNSAQLTVTQATLNISAISQSKTYGQTFTVPANGFTVTGLVPGDSVSSVNLSATGTGANATVTGGPYYITPSAAAGSGLGNYKINYFPGTLTINPANLFITANNNKKIYGQTVTFTGTEFTTSALYNGDTVTSATISSGGVVATASAIAWPISVSAAVGTGLSNYNINYVAGVLTVQPAPLTVYTSAVQKTYGQTYNFAGTEFTTSGLLNSDTVLHVSLNSAGAAPGAQVSATPYTINAVGAVGNGLTNYNISYVSQGALTVVPAQLIVTAKPIMKMYGQSYTFGGTEFTAVTLYNSDSITNVSLSSSGAVATATVTGGPYTINVSNAVGNGLSNYAITYQTGILKVTPAPLSITAGSFAKIYGQTLALPSTPPSAFTTSGLLFSDSVSSVTLSSPGTVPTATVYGGPYAVTPSSAMGPGLTNYTVSYLNGSLKVNPAPLTVTVNNQTKMYGQTFSFTGTEYMANTLLNGDTLGTIAISSAGSPGTAPVAGSPYPIIATPGSASNMAALNYSISYNNGSMTVRPAPLTITASSSTMVIGGPVPAITPGYAGFVNSEGPGNLTTLPSCKTTVTSSSAAGTYTNADTCGGAADTNYAFTYVAGTMKVTYNIAALYSQTTPTNPGSSLPVKVQIKNYGGTNLSASKIALTVTGLAPSPAPGVVPSGTFTYMSMGDAGPMYQLNVKTTNYPAGTYTLSFSVAGDPISHTVNFVIF